MKAVPGIRFIDNVFPWTYAFMLESEMFKRRIITVGPQHGQITIHARLGTTWDALAKRGGTPDDPGPATLPGFTIQSGMSALKPLLDHELTYASVNFDVMGNPHPSPTRPGSLVVLLFLTSNWVEAMGGEVFFYTDESRKEIIQASSPIFNRAIVFDGAIPYTVRPPTKAAEYPKLTATFVVNKGPASDELLGEIVMIKGVENILVFDNFFAESYRAKLETALYEMQYDIANTDRHDTQKYCNGEPSADFIQNVGLREELKKTPIAAYADYEIMSTGTNVDTAGMPHYNHIHPGQFVFLYYPAKTWQHEWGGETLFFDRDGKEIAFASPYTPNRCIFFEGMTSHTIRSPTTLAPFPRVTFGIFFQKRGGFFEKLPLP